MAQVEVAQLKPEEKDRLVCTYAALLLHDGELDITGDKLSKVITASGNAVEGYWPGLFAKALQGQDIAKLLANVGSAPATASAGQASGDAGAVQAEDKQDAVKEDEPADDVDMVGLFDDEDY